MVHVIYFAYIIVHTEVHKVLWYMSYILLYSCMTYHIGDNWYYITCYSTLRIICYSACYSYIIFIINHLRL